MIFGQIPPLDFPGAHLSRFSSIWVRTCTDLNSVCYNSFTEQEQMTDALV